MDEHFLHYIWKHQKHNAKELKLTNGQTLKVFNQGFHNYNSGPDFEEARIKIDEVEWIGCIEIHIKSSDWFSHGHSSNDAYRSVILHVVWSHDRDVMSDGMNIPTLELKNIVDPALINRYSIHVSHNDRIVCGSQLSQIQSIKYQSMLDRVLVERLEEKAKEVLKTLKQTNNDWESATYQTFARNFGFSTNKAAFEQLSLRLPFHVLKKNLQNQFKTEALIFGQAGFLAKASDSYQKQLREEFHFLKTKYELPDQMNKSEWKFGRMRPASFPSVRLAQFAALLHQNTNLFSRIKFFEHSKDLTSSVLTSSTLTTSIKINHPSYWQSHYDFGKPRKSASKGPGSSTLNNILINSVSPILAAYGKFSGEQHHMDQAVALLEGIKPEANRHTKAWEELGRKPDSAFESQAQIQLIQSYCEKKRCLDCNIGVYLLSK
ncbi:MAG: DUF2851 family protein [Ekhidna sp.]|nr:DUF2851 family protein [Ekhidna sp.]